VRRPTALAAALCLGTLAARAETPGAIFTAEDWGLVVRYPSGLRVSTRFRKSYLDFGAWRVSYAAGPGEGTPIVSFALPDLHVKDAGGAGEASAELRIGASRDPTALATCRTYGMNSGNNVEERTRVIGGLTFTEVPDNSDASMMTQIRSDDFRALDGGTCWAIDIIRITAGTSESPPDYPPAQLALLERVLDGISFTQSGDGKR